LHVGCPRKVQITYINRHPNILTAKKSLSNTQTIVTATGSQISLPKIKQVQNKLSSELMI